MSLTTHFKQGEPIVARKTNYMVYVDKDAMKKPAELCDAVMSHFIKKDMDVALRKRFMIQFMHAPTDGLKLKVVDEWVMIRDVATFPFRKDKPEVKDEEEMPSEDTGVETGVPVDDKPDGKPVEGVTPD